MDTFLLPERLPDTHPDLLIVRLRPPYDGGVASAAVAQGRPVETGGNSRGLELLSRLEQGGKITGVFPLDIPQDAGPPTAPSAGILSALATTSARQNVVGADIVRVSDWADVNVVVNALQADPDVQFASRVPVRYTTVSPRAGWSTTALGQLEGRIGRLEARLARQAPGGASWNLRRIEYEQARGLGIADGSGVRVGVLDTGVDPGHPDLLGRIQEYHAGENGLTGMTSDRDVVGHGTHVCGVIASRFNGAFGTTGITAAPLLVWKIFDDTPDYVAGSSLYWYLVDPVLYRRALADCIGRTDVLNLSIGGREPPDQQEAMLFQALQQQGTTIVAAMGNERLLGSPTSYPAAIAGVLAIGATQPDDTVANFSNAGRHIALCAPGAAIWSTMPTYQGQIGFRAAFDAQGRPTPGQAFPRDTTYAAMSGTSMAAPHVTAALALVLANRRQRPEAGWMRDLLLASADRVPAMAGARWTPDYGSGRLNLRRLMLGATRL